MMNIIEFIFWGWSNINYYDIFIWMLIFLTFGIIIFWMLVYIFAPDYSQIIFCPKCNSDFDLNNNCNCDKIESLKRE